MTLRRAWLTTVLVLAPALPSAVGQQARFPTPQSLPAAGAPALRVSGRYFYDPAGRVVVLRGVNLSGGAKVPPFVPAPNLSVLDRLPGLGVNVLRLVFIWEAYEPTPGGYDEAYLARMKAVAAAAWARGLYVIVDIHQDGFARSLSRGSGDGFPPWAVSRRAAPVAPDNGPGCRLWPVFMATDLGMHRSFEDFYRDATGVRTRYLLMLRRVAAAFADVPGVIGYDPLNEPWGDERRDIGPLYRDAAAAIRSVAPSAILFLEGHVTTNCGLQTRLGPPGVGNVAYAPHYYQPSTIFRGRWRGKTSTIDRAFAHMEAKAAEWNAPLFLGEFGAPAEAKRCGDYVSYLYDRLDRGLSSGAQWNYSPTWNPRDKDGWNGEDFSVLEPSGRPRPNLAVRPHPVAFAGDPRGFRFDPSASPGGGPALDLAWEHHPGRGATEVHLPAGLFPRASALTVEGPGATVWRDEARQRLVIVARTPGVVRVRLNAPPASGRPAPTTGD